MPTPGERRALIFIAAIAALGVAVRGLKELRGAGAAPPVVSGDRAGLARQIEAVDSAIAVGGAKRRGRVAQRKNQPGGPVRSNATTRRGAGNREQSDPSRVPPESPPTSRYPRAWVTPPPVDGHEVYRQRWARADSARRAINERSGSGAPRSPASRRLAASRRPATATSGPPVDLDVASIEEIAALPLVGPALARRIVADRIERGPFGSIEGLERVRGISKGLGRRLQPYVTFSLASRLEGVGTESPPARRKRRP